MLSSLWISAKITKEASTSIPGLSMSSKKYPFKAIQIVQKFISSNSKTIQLSPFDYKKSETTKVDNIDWDKAFDVPISPSKKEPTPQNFNLNLVDLDFLECMGMAPAPVAPKVEKKPVGPPVKQP